MQPFLHEVVTCVRAPLAAVGGPDGQIAHRGAEGVHWRDRRSLCELVVAVGGRPPEPVGWQLVGVSSAHFVGAAMGLVTELADPTVLVERTREARADGLTESITVHNLSRRRVDTELTVVAACDFASLASIKDGAPAPPPAPVTTDDGGARWSAAGQVVRLAAWGDAHDVAIDHSPGGRATMRWPLSLPSRSSTTIRLDLTVQADGGDGWFRSVTSPPWRNFTTVSASPALDALIARSCEDVAGLIMSDGDDLVPAAGAPWFLTLFGRDSIWTARMMLPLGTELAEGTLRALARRQSTSVDDDRSAEPGKILHELRPGETRFEAHRDADSGTALRIPATYYGTVDATPLWISLLHDAWRWGLPADRVAELRDPLERALGWVSRRLDADGFLTYRDATGHGLANQGWKDSGDAIQDAAGVLAPPPVTLCEVQGYAFRALLDGADLLDALGRPGSAEARDRAAALSTRFRERFWVERDGARFPAIALDGAGRQVDSLSSNIAHLPGTGLLDGAEEVLIARLVESPLLSGGFGLRTLSARHPQFNPLGYHSGSVWPHDTAIAIVSLCRAGFAPTAAALARGLVEASTHFGARLPELFGGRSRDDGPPLAYPAACRPQAWAAAAGVALLGSILGITADAPAGRYQVLPDPAFAEYFPLIVRGVRLGTDVVEVSIDGHGRAEVAARPEP